MRPHSSCVGQHGAAPQRSNDLRTADWNCGAYRRPCSPYNYDAETIELAAWRPQLMCLRGTSLLAGGQMTYGPTGPPKGCRANFQGLFFAALAIIQRQFRASA